MNAGECRIYLCDKLMVYAQATEKIAAKRALTKAGMVKVGKRWLSYASLHFGTRVGKKGDKGFDKGFGKSNFGKGDYKGGCKSKDLIKTLGNLGHIAGILLNLSVE
jgi:hypothetical protein